jgi:hypothetical protein
MAYVENYIVPIVAFIIFILGCVGNGTLIFLIARYRQLKTIQNAFILSIAVADMLVALVCAPVFGVTYAIPETWMFGVAMCKLYGFLTTMSPALSIFTLTVLSIERCTETFNQSCNVGNMTRKGKAGLLFLLWFVSISLGLPNLIFANVQTLRYSGGASVCFQHPVELGGQYTRMDTLLRFLILLAVPVVTTVVSFTLIAINLLSTNVQQNVDPANLETTKQVQTEMKQPLSKHPERSSVSHNKTRFTILVMTLCAAYALCWLSFYIYMMWFFFYNGEYNRSWHVFRIFALCLSFSDCCIRSWFIFGLHPTFNHYFKKHLCCCFGRTPSNEAIPLNDQQ